MFLSSLLALFRNAVPQAPASVDPTVLTTLSQILKEIKEMSGTQTQQSADIAQMAADLAVIKPAFQTLVDKITALQAAASAGTVSADLQAQIDDLHAFAQSVAPAGAPQGTGTAL